MMLRNLSVVLMSCGIAACGSTSGDEPADEGSGAAGGGPSQPTAAAPDEFPPPKKGQTRIVAPVVDDIQPGDDVMYCQHVLEPFDRDMDILSVGGYQSRGGHHVVAFATTEKVPVGTSRLCEGQDNLSGAFLGGVGGEAGTGNPLPEGVAFRLKKGSGIMLNTHFLNTWEETFDGRSVLDIEFAEVDPDRTIAGFFVNLQLGFSLPPGERSVADTTCTLPRDLEFFAFANHMHDYGRSAFTELTRVDGTVEMVREDPKWSYEMQFNADYSRWPVDEPLLLRGGDTLHTHCEWENPSSADVTFPREMCIGVGFFRAEESTFPICAGGAWMEGAGSGASTLLDGPPCAGEGAAGNDLGVGRYCTKGGGECAATASICLADYTTGTFGNFCMKLCSANADCGAGAACTGATSGSSTKVCMPTECVGKAIPAQP